MSAPENRSPTKYWRPSSIAAAYHDRLQAPLKGVVWFEESAHFPFFEEPGRFQTEMNRIMPGVQAFWPGES